MARPPDRQGPRATPQGPDAERLRHAMAKLTISDAARVTGVSRVTLHRYIKAGKLSRTPDGLIDTAEILRIGLVLHPDTLQQPFTVQRPATPPATPPVTADTPTLERLIEVL